MYETGGVCAEKAEVARYLMLIPSLQAHPTTGVIPQLEGRSTAIADTLCLSGACSRSDHVRQSRELLRTGKNYR